MAPIRAHTRAHTQAFTAPAPGVAPRSFEVYEGKFKCLHPTRPLSSACGDCPRRGRMQLQQVLMFAVDAKKSKCVHPGRPMSQVRGVQRARAPRGVWQAGQESRAALNWGETRTSRSMQACADCPRRGFKMDHDVDMPF